MEQLYAGRWARAPRGRRSMGRCIAIGAPARGTVLAMPATTTTSLPGLPEARAAQAPGAPCIADDSVTLDNAAFADRVARAGALLARHGVGAGDVVAVAL